MPPVHLSCPHCTGILQVETHLAGRQVTCPTCMGVVTIPLFGPDGDASPAYAPPPPAPPPSPEPVPLACPHCTGVFQVLPSMSGQQVACPHCQGVITVPELGPPAANPTAPSFAAPPPPAPSYSAPTYPGPPHSAPVPQVSHPQPFSQPIPTIPSGLGGGAARPVPVAPRPDAGPIVPVESRSRTVGKGNEKIELKKLTPEERAQRRRTRNLIMAVAFIGLLFVVFMILLAVE